MKYKKIESIKKIKKYGLPFPETIFIFDFKKQEEAIDRFLKNREYVAIRTDSAKNTDFLPYNLRCHKKKAKKTIKKFNDEGYAVILHEQNHIPSGVINKNHISGNIVILEKCWIIELMRGEPLSSLTRKGEISEYLKIRKNNLTEVAHWGKRIISRDILDKILRMIRKIPKHKVIEFTFRPEGFYFWQIREDKTAKKLDK